MSEQFDVEDYIEHHLVPKALERIDLLLDSSNESTVREVAKDVLDRGKTTNRKSGDDNRSVNVLNFDPKYLATAVKGMIRVLKDDTSVDEQGVDNQES